MIFVTTGTQEPFDRLIKTIDQVALLLKDEIFIVQAITANYIPANFKLTDFITPVKFNEIFQAADLIVSHAGMGTIISAMEAGKPLIIMPRLLKYGEHRNEHQLATAKKLKDLHFVHIAFDENELKNMLLTISKDKIKPLKIVEKFASASLIHSLETFINA